MIFKYSNFPTILFHAQNRYLSSPIPMASHDRLSHETVVADLCGALLASPSPFPYYFLVAIEAGSFFRGILLLLLYPLILLISHYHSKSLATNIMIFISMGGLKVKEIKLVSRSVLPKFFVEDVRQDAWSLFNMSCKRVVMTSCPTVMVESFARDYLGADKVVGRELEVHLPTGRATGFVKEVGFGKEFGFEFADLWVVAASGEDTPLELKKLCKVKLNIKSCFSMFEETFNMLVVIGSYKRFR